MKPYVFALLLFTWQLANCADFDWRSARGFNVSAAARASDLKAVKSSGANVIRVSFPDHQLLSTSGLSTNNLAKLDAIVDVAREHDLAVIIDPHTFPGFSNKYTTKPTDPFWTSQRDQELFVRFWQTLAQRYAGASRTQTIAFDLLNEPVVPNASWARGPYNALVKSTVNAIRRESSYTYLIIEPARYPGATGKYVSSFFAMRHLALPADTRLIVSPHMYQPLTLTHAGVENRSPHPPEYPGVIEGVRWDRSRLLEEMAPPNGWPSHVAIFVGEFGASVFSGSSGNQYILDFLHAAKVHQYGWAFHAFRENPVWDAESPLPHQTQPSRWRILLDAFQRP